MNEKNRKNAEQVSTMLNSFTFDYEGFCKEMCREHRTLQQSFTRLCIHWLATCASDNYQFDGRNEASHDVAKALLDAQDAEFVGYLTTMLPMI